MKQKRTIDALVEFAKGDHNALNDLEMGSRGYAIAEGEFALARAEKHYYRHSSRCNSN